MRRLSPIVALLVVLLLPAGAQAHKTAARSCGRTSQGAYVTVAKGDATCREARELLQLAGHLGSDGPEAVYLPSGKAGVTNTSHWHGSAVHPPLWTCSGVTSLPHSAEGIVCTRGHNEIVLRFPTRAELKQEAEETLDLECARQTFLSLECEAAGFTEGVSAKQEEREWYAECERGHEKEPELSEEGPRTPTPAEAKADCKAEHERDERENT
jgi:hypothetical protein